MNQQPQATSVKSFLKTISILHFAMIAGIVAIAVMAYTTSNGESSLSFTQEPMELLAPGLLIAAIFIGRFISKIILSKGIQDKKIQQKLAVYQTAHLIRIAPIEGVGMFAGVMYLTYNNLFFLCIAGIALLILFTHIPSKEKIENAIHPTAEEQTYFRNPDKSFDS